MNAKFHKHNDHFESLHVIERTTNYPTTLGVEIMASCNLRCGMCTATWRRDNPKGKMAFDMFKKIIDESCQHSDCCSVCMMGRGDPSLHPQLLDFIDYAKSHDVNTHMTTHGNFKPSLIEDMIDAGLTYLRISLDAFSPEAYAKVREGGDFFQAYEAALHMCKFADKLKLAVSFVQQDGNDGELDQFVSFWGPKPVKVIVTRKVLLNSLMPALETEVPQCAAPWRRIVVHCNGDTFSCYNAAYNDVDSQKEYMLGNVATHSIKDMWLSKQMTNLRLMNSKERPIEIPICMDCKIRC